MSTRVSVLWPFLIACLLLTMGYLLLNPAATLRAASQATVWQVDRQDDPSLPTGTGCTAADDDCSLRGAIEQAASGDTIELAEAGTILLSDALTLTKNLTITSATAADHIIDGSENNTIFVIAAGQSVILSELTLQNGRTVEDGGAVRMEQGTLTMTHVVLQDNVAEGVGGALSVNPTSGIANVFLSDATFLRNRAFGDFQSGGAIHAFARNNREINLWIENSHFEGNSGGTTIEDAVDGYGGAISASTLDGNSMLLMEIRNSVFTSNSSGLGGALYLQSFARNSGSSSLQGVVYDSRFTLNEGEQGGAIHLSALDGGSQATLTISNTTIATNTATNSGGGIYHQSYNRNDSNATGAALTIHNSTLSNNQADANEGGALYTLGLASGNVEAHASVELLNVTMSGNRTLNADGGAIYASSGGFTKTSTLITATHVTFFDNSVAGQSAISLADGTFDQTALTLKNSLIQGSGMSCTTMGSTISGANNLISDTTCGSATPFRLGSPSGIIPTLADNGGSTLTHGLYAGSNALDAVPAGQCTAGNSTTLVTTDQRGLARPFGAACDIGAFETQTISLPTLPGVTGLEADNDGPTEVNNPTLLSASITGGEDVSFAWSFGDGSSGSGITATHTYTQSGIYTATVVASNPTNSLTATTTVYVGDAIVEVGSNFYNPTEVNVPAGGTVVWVWRAGTHSVTADDGSFEQPLGSNWPPFIYTLAAVQSFERSDATVSYHCTLHGAPGGIGMSGKVIVEDVEPGDDQVKLRLPSIIREEE